MPIIIDENGRREVTQKQLDAYMAKLSKSKPDFEPIVDAEVQKVLTEHWYTGIGEVGALASFSNPYQSEAQAILTWYAEIYHFLELNKDIENEQDFIDLMTTHKNNTQKYESTTLDDFQTRYTGKHTKGIPT